MSVIANSMTGLADTGAAIPWIAAIVAIALLVFGAVFLIAARRRRDRAEETGADVTRGTDGIDGGSV